MSSAVRAGTAHWFRYEPSSNTEANASRVRSGAPRAAPTSMVSFALARALSQLGSDAARASFWARSWLSVPATPLERWGGEKALPGSGRWARAPDAPRPQAQGRAHVRAREPAPAAAAP